MRSSLLRKGLALTALAVLGGSANPGRADDRSASAPKSAIAPRPAVGVNPRQYLPIPGVASPSPTPPPSQPPAETAAVAPKPALYDPKATRTQVPDLLSIAETPSLEGRSISLNAALYGSITANPDLVALRQNAPASAEAVEVARRFPTTLNPTLWIDYRPLTFERAPHGGYARAYPFLYLSWRQPIELGHQTTHRHNIAKAAFSQQQWTIIQAELLAIVQTYRFFETAAYRRERLRVAGELADFNERLFTTLKRRLEVNPAGAADVALSEVELEATRQLVEAARNDYAVALTDLHNQMGTPDTAGQALPADPFVAPSDLPTLDEAALVSLALVSRPEIHIARAQVAGARAAVCLANGDRRPTPVIGPEYERDQAGVIYIGFVAIIPMPVLNNGKPLVRQREAEYRRALTVLQQIEQRTTTQVRAAVAKWNQARRLVERTKGLTSALARQVGQIERLFEANQTDLTKLLQAQQRLIQLENAELDAVWQATQAHADLLTALGAPNLINGLMQQVEAATTAPPSAPMQPSPAPPPPMAPDAIR